MGLFQDCKQRRDVLELLVKRIPLAALLMLNYRKPPGAAIMNWGTYNNRNLFSHRSGG